MIYLGSWALASGCAVLAFTACSAPALAQTQTGARAEATGPSQLEEIVVTVRRREERMQDVPTAVTALTATTLSRLNIVKTEDLNTAVAGLTITHVGDRQRPFFTLRGQGQQSNGGEPGVQIYFDEVPLIRGGLDFFDLGQIEVLRGPQGTLFGRNTTGGALRIRPALPSFESDGYVEARVGDYDARALEGAINIPIIADKVAVRVSGMTVRRDGYVKNLVDGSHQGDEHTDSLRGQVLFTPTDAFEDRVLVAYRKMDANASGIMLNRINAFGVPAFDAAFLQAYQLALASDFTEWRSNMRSLSTANELTIENIASYHLTDDITARYIFGHVRSRIENDNDVDGTPLPIIEALNYRNNQADTHEAQLLGKSLEGKLDWIVGGYYEKTKTVDPDRLRLISFGAPSVTLAELDGTSKALYTQGTYQFNPQWSVTAGIRETWDVRNGLTGRAIGTAAPALTNDTQFKASAPNWTLSLNYKPSDNLLFYVANRRGYKSGGINSFVNPPLPTSFQEEKLTDVEVGMKADWAAGVILQRLNVAAFYGLYENMQRSGTFVGPQGLATLIYDAGKAHTKGAEIEYNARFGALFEVAAQYAYLNVDFNEYTDPNGLPLSGQEAAYSPAHKASLTGTFYAPIPEAYGEVSLVGTWAYQSEAYLSEPNLVQVHNSEYSLLDFSLNWDNVMRSPVGASLFVQNATDERHFTGTALPTIGAVTRNAPRMYGLKVRYRFGASAER